MLVGAALVLGASVVLGGSSGLSAAVSSGDRATFFPVAPARLLETRTEAEGGGGTVDGLFAGVGALASGSTLDLQVTGRANVPAEATSVVLNVTAVDQRGSLSFVTVFPTGTTRPNASSLNPLPGAPPAPNGVTASIGAGGQVSFFTLVGPVHLLADVVGYYAPHDHDDRYFTKAQVDAKFATTSQTNVSGAGFGGSNTVVFQDGCMRSTTVSQVLVADVSLPLGATITSIAGHMFDTDAAAGRLRLIRVAGNGITQLAEILSTGTSLATFTSNLATPERVDTTDYFFLEYLGGTAGTTHRICGATITYTIPSGRSLT